MPAAPAGRTGGQRCALARMPGGRLDRVGRVTDDIRDTPAALAFADDLAAFIDASPSPFHACQQARQRLVAEGFTEVDERAPWPTSPGRYLLVCGGSLVAWTTPQRLGGRAAFRIVGAHTDSPNLRVKDQPDSGTAGWQQVAMDPYGGALVASWMDRDLGLSGRVVTADGERLLLVDEPILRVPQLAIHLDREVHTSGVRPDPQRHLTPVWATGRPPAPGEFVEWIAGRLGVATGDILGFDLMAHDVTPSRRVGRDRTLLAAPRLDNQCSCHAGLSALITASDRRAGTGAERDTVPVLVLFDHEEVGSSSERGAASPLLATTLERIALAAGRDRDGYLRMLAGSACASSDMAHATHPNYPEKHEPLHPILAGGGPVLKVNHNLRYATDGRGAALFTQACAQAGVPLQHYLHRADLPCGSTIGPITATRLGITTVDVGAPQLAMHSVRETMSALDPIQLSAALGAFLAPA